jgi:hypothetical protein
MKIENRKTRQIRKREDLGKYCRVRGFFHFSYSNNAIYKRNFGEIYCNDLALFMLGDISNKRKELAESNKPFQHIPTPMPVIASHSYENNKVFEKYSIGFLIENKLQPIANAINRMVCLFIENGKKTVFEYNLVGTRESVTVVFLLKLILNYCYVFYTLQKKKWKLNPPFLKNENYGNLDLSHLASI